MDTPSNVIVKGVPLPKPSYMDRKLKYPFDTIEVGGMFFLPGKTENTFTTYASLWGRKLGRTFRTRLLYMREDAEKVWQPCEETDENAVLGVGVWRVEDPKRQGA